MKERAERYANLINEVHRLCPERILEIGTYRGGHAEQMIRAAAQHRPASEIEYYGFDLFGPAPAHECTPRTVAPRIEKVSARLRATGAFVGLVAGDSRKTLPECAPSLPKMDLVFIDGGHSEETIRSDWSAIQSLIDSWSVVFFDDFWSYQEGGCNALVAELQEDSRFVVDVLPPVDRFTRPWGVLETQMVKVTLA